MGSVFLMPTPGHTDGQKSLIVHRPNGAVIVAGQCHETATQSSPRRWRWRT
jgi:N-acyl homoserine lactone hydrolase